MMKLICVLAVCLMGFVSGTGETCKAHFESNANFSSCAFDEQAECIRPPKDRPIK